MCTWRAFPPKKVADLASHKARASRVDTVRFQKHAASSEPQPGYYSNTSNFNMSTSSDTVKFTDMELPMDNHQVLVQGATGSLENMLADLLDVLRKQTGTAVKLSGQLTLTIAETKTYTITLANAIEKEGHLVQAKVALEKPTASRKRPNDQDHQSSPKRIKSNGDNVTVDDARNDARNDAPPIPVTAHSPTSSATLPESTLVLAKLNELSEQIHWLEQCRRLDEQHHSGREDNWRSSSANFHDDNRRARETHEQWLVAEMGWQRNTLLAIANQTTANSVVQQSVKWETPVSTAMSPAHSHIIPPLAPTPPKPPRQKASGSKKLPKSALKQDIKK